MRNDECLSSFVWVEEIGKNKDGPSLPLCPVNRKCLSKKTKIAVKKLFYINPGKLHECKSDKTFPHCTKNKVFPCEFLSQI